jgi:hypothetical protein
LERARLSRLRNDGTEGAEGEVVIDPIGADNEQEDQSKKNNDARDRNAPSVAEVAI